MPAPSPWLLSGLILLAITAVLAVFFLWTYRPANALTPHEARELLQHKNIQAVIDVRTDAEWAAGHYRDAIHIPIQQLPQQLPDQVPDRETAILFYCRTGHRAAMAAARAQELGYTNVSYLRGGSYRDLTHRYRFEKY
jgi:rhodanese-related sulfurtransferase